MVGTACHPDILAQPEPLSDPLPNILLLYAAPWLVWPKARAIAHSVLESGTLVGTGPSLKST